MEAVVGGWVAGYGMGVATTVVLTYFAWNTRESPAVDRFVASEVHPALVGVLVFMGATIAWTMVGIAAGSAYRLAGLDDGGWPGTEFYTVVAGFAALPMPALLLLWPRWWWIWVAMAALVVALFGGVMPALAGL